MPANGTEFQDGLLKVHRHPEGQRLRIVFAGELDLANIKTAEIALREAIVSGLDVVVDLRQLEFLDSSGIALLLEAIRNPGSRLSFLPSERLEVRRVLRITGIDQKMVTAEPESGLTSASAA